LVFLSAVSEPVVEASFVVAVKFSFPLIHAVPSPSPNVFPLASVEDVLFTGSADGDFLSFVAEVSAAGVVEAFFALSEKVSEEICFSCADVVSFSGGMLE
jgi:hypothetical protein